MTDLPAGTQPTPAQHEINFKHGMDTMKEALKMLSWEQCFQNECDKAINKLNKRIARIKSFKEDRRHVLNQAKDRINSVINDANKGEYCNVESVIRTIGPDFDAPDK